MVTVLSLAATLGSEVLERKASLMLLNMVFVIGLFVFIGNSGVLSFGHAAFMGLGAYTFAFMTANPQLKKTTLPDAPAFLRGRQHRYMASGRSLGARTSGIRADRGITAHAPERARGRHSDVSDAVCRRRSHRPTGKA